MKLKLFHMITSLEPYGAQTLLLETLRLLDRNLFESEVGYFTPGETADALQVIGVPTYQFKLKHLIDIQCMLEMVRFMQTKRFDIVHTHMAKADFYGRTAARLAGVPIVLSTVHNEDVWKSNPIFNNINRLSVKFTDELIAVSESVRNYVVAIREALPEKVIVIYNGIDPDKFKRPPSSERNWVDDIPEDIFVIVCIARLYQQKGQIYLIRAMREVVNKFPKTELLLIGDGPLEAALKKEVERLCLGNHVIFLGRMKDVSMVLSRCNLVVLPSIWEGFGIALIEGMANRKPVVATNVGGIPEIIEDGKMGRLVPPRDSFALANAILEIAGNKEKAERMGLLGQEKVNNTFDLHRIAPQVQARYLAWARKKQIISRSQWNLLPF